MHPVYSVDQILTMSWDRKLADDLAIELENFSGERRDTIEEVRRFLALKGYRELLARITEAREEKKSWAALKAVAVAMRAYALQRPGLSAAGFRTPATDCPEWREAYEQTREFMIGLFAECGLYGGTADEALHILRSLVRGFVLHEVMNSFLHVHSYDETYEHAVDVFVAGLRSVHVENSSTRPKHPIRRDCALRRR
jgi:hypothetical protein